MTERLSDEMTLLLDEGEQRSHHSSARALLHARLAVSLSEGLARDAHINGHAGDYDSALMAALLDGGATPAECDALVARLGDDPAARADLAAAKALIDSIEGAAETPPPALLARAAEIFAPAPAAAVAQAGGGWVQSLLAISSWHPATKFGMATAVMLVVAMPVLVPIMRDGDGSLHDDGPVGRGLGPTRGVKTEAPAAAAAGKDARNCETAETPMVTVNPANEQKTASSEPAQPAAKGAKVHAPAPSDDPCARKTPAQNPSSTLNK